MTARRRSRRTRHHPALLAAGLALAVVVVLNVAPHARLAPGDRRDCRVPSGRPGTEAEARAAARSSSEPSIAAARRVTGGPDPALVLAWAAMPEWADDWDAIMWRPDLKAGECKDCGRQCVAEPGRTMV